MGGTKAGVCLRKRIRSSKQKPTSQRLTARARARSEKGDNQLSETLPKESKALISSQEHGDEREREKKKITVGRRKRPICNTEGMSKRKKGGGKKKRPRPFSAEKRRNDRGNLRCVPPIWSGAVTRKREEATIETEKTFLRKRKEGKGRLRSRKGSS